MKIQFCESTLQRNPGNMELNKVHRFNEKISIVNTLICNIIKINICFCLFIYLLKG